MSYENAPATRMLAVFCACCGRPLVDAISVEWGIGPVCRDKLGISGLIDEEVRRLCNQLTHAAALYCQQGRVVEVRRCAHAIRLTGLVELADAIETRFKSAEKKVKIKIEELPDGRLAVDTPFRRGEKQEFVDAWRAVPGRRWDRDRSVNTVPATSKAEVWRLLRRFFPGHYVSGPKGVFKLPSAEEQATLEQAAAVEPQQELFA